MTKYDRTFEVGKKYVNRTSKWGTYEEPWGRDGYVILLSRTPKIKSGVDRYGHEYSFTLYPVECNGKKGWCELRMDKVINKDFKKETGFDTYEHMHRVTSTGFNWAPHSVGNGAEIY